MRSDPEVLCKVDDILLLPHPKAKKAHIVEVTRANLVVLQDLSNCMLSKREDVEVDITMKHDQFYPRRSLSHIFEDAATRTM